jgi:thioredoxin-like negative regulator of GroEL
MKAARRGTALLAAIAFALACVGPNGGAREANRIEDVADRGDAQRRASTRLVLDGLDADARGDARLAQSRYERAIQIDASNPYAYLALARHYVEQEDPDRALAYLDHAGSLFESTDDDTPGAETHLIGLRGAALDLAGRSQEADPLLHEAAQRAPALWGDGHLDAAELR